jgi:hypothetical protein
MAMSWRTVNQILGLASIDPAFWHILQTSPLSATEALGFELTLEEQMIFRECASLSFPDFCLHVFQQLAPEQQDNQSSKNL